MRLLSFPLILVFAWQAASCGMGTVVGNGDKPDDDDKGSEKQNGQNNDYPGGSTFSGVGAKAYLSPLFANCGSPLAAMSAGKNLFAIEEPPGSADQVTFDRSGDLLEASIGSESLGQHEIADDEGYQILSRNPDDKPNSEIKGDAYTCGSIDITTATIDETSYEMRSVTVQSSSQVIYKVQWYENVSADSRVDLILVIQGGEPYLELRRVSGE